MSADIHGLVGAFAVDAVDEQERTAFEQHLAQCPECQAEVASLREAAAQLSLTTEMAPPPALRDAVLAGIRTVRPLPPEAPHASSTVVPLRPRRRVVTWLAAAAVAAAVLVGGLVWSPWDRSDQRAPVTATEQVLEAKDAQRFVKVIGGARATIVRSPSLGKAVIIADNMPAAPDGKDFQVWFDQPQRGMVSAGVMPHGSAPTVTLLLQGDATTATAAGITVEPAGGSRSPTTAPVALFSFS